MTKLTADFQAYKIRLLLSLMTDDEPIQFLTGIPVEQLLPLRDFLYLQFSDLSRRVTGREIPPGEMQKNLVPVRYYFEKHDCDEIVDSCLADSCYANNPSCFREKLNGQLVTQIRMLRNLLFPEPDSEQELSDG